jgi:N-acetylneuraminic acid mutarotase
MPLKRGGIAAAVLGRRIYVFGGEAKWDDYVTLDATESYSPDTDQWMTHTPMPGTRHGLGAAVFGGRIYVIGGSPKWGSVQGSTANEVFIPEGGGPRARP